MTPVADLEKLLMQPDPPRVKFSSVQLWMEDADLEVQGAAYALLTQRSAVKWDSVPSAADADRLIRPYLARCMRVGCRGTWVHSRYEAARDLADWIASAWFGTGPRPGEVSTVVEWLGELYLGSDESLRRALVDGVLEHLFEKAAIRQAFEGWKADPRLATAYGEAAEWADGHQST